jgi:hypothetical protein
MFVLVYESFYWTHLVVSRFDGGRVALPYKGSECHAECCSHNAASYRHANGDHANDEHANDDHTKLVILLFTKQQSLVYGLHIGSKQPFLAPVLLRSGMPNSKVLEWNDLFIWRLTYNTMP